MSLNRGSLSYVRFFVDRQIEVSRAQMIEAIQLRAFRPLKASDEEDERVGWCSVHHAIDLDLTPEKVFDGDFVNLGLRFDRFRIPGAILKAHMAEAETAMLAELGKERLSRAQKEDLRAMVVVKLRQRSMPSMRVHDVSWNTETGIVRFFATSPKAHDALHEIFEKTFGADICREGFYTRATRHFDTESLDALTTIEPFMIHHGADQ